MKKIISVMLGIMSIFIVGCSSSKVEVASTLEDAYFDILNKNINEEQISEKYLRQLLSGYTYKKGEEELDTNRFMVSTRSSDMNKHIEISNKLTHKKGQWDDIYHTVSNNVVDINDMDIDSIKKLVRMEPSVEEYEDKLETDSNHKVLVYNFETDEEMLTVEYLRDTNKIWRVMYVDKDSSTIKNIANKHLLKNGAKLHTGILTYVENAKMQRDLIEVTNKSYI